MTAEDTSRSTVDKSFAHAVAALALWMYLPRNRSDEESPAEAESPPAKQRGTCWFA